MSGIDRSGGELLVHVVSDGQVGEAMIEGVTGHQCARLPSLDQLLRHRRLARPWRARDNDQFTYCSIVRA